ncbi:MAG: primosomal protein N' [Deltaproteobacteria bacterium]|nr:primosomal protein N' [Deltaproteobacteria bacterium]
MKTTIFPEKGCPADGGDEPKIFQVAVDSPVPSYFSYLAPPGLNAEVGQMVRVPLARREVLGYVMAPGQPPPAGGRTYKLKEILEIVVPEPLFNREMAELVDFVSDYYFYPPGLCVKEILPGGLSPKLRTGLRLTEAGLAAAAGLGEGDGGGQARLNSGVFSEALKSPGKSGRKSAASGRSPAGPGADPASGMEALLDLDLDAIIDAEFAALAEAGSEAGPGAGSDMSAGAPAAGAGERDAAPGSPAVLSPEKTSEKTSEKTAKKTSEKPSAKPAGKPRPAGVPDILARLGRPGGSEPPWMRDDYRDDEAPPPGGPESAGSPDGSAGGGGGPGPGFGRGSFSGPEDDGGSYMGVPPPSFSSSSSSSPPSPPLSAMELLGLLAGRHPEAAPMTELAPYKTQARLLVSEGLAEVVRSLDSRGAGFSYEWYLSPAAGAKTILSPPDKRTPARLGPKEKILWDLIKDAPPTPLGHFRQVLPKNILVQARSLAAKGLVVMERRERFRDDPDRALEVAPSGVETLTPDQEAALREIGGALANRDGRGFLLFGVTGSGKTEVYLRAAARALDMGLGVLWLAPEIALTMGLEGRVRERFPSLPVSVLHSALTPGQRHDHWRAILRGGRRLVIGARSAVFAPMSDVGLVVVDEEHDWAYKQDDGLRYHGRDLAAWRAGKAGAVLILGSATPSLESYQRARDGKLTLLRLTGRPGSSVMPEVTIVDRRGQRPGGARDHLAPLVRARLRETFEAGEQALMFINRRGLANAAMCFSCGQTLKCPHCSLSLTLHSDLDKGLRVLDDEGDDGWGLGPYSGDYHPDGRSQIPPPAPPPAGGPVPAPDGKGGAGGAGAENDAAGGSAPGGGSLEIGPENLLVCHGCGHRARPPKLCPACKSRLFRYLGVGTESLQREIEKSFGKKGLRLDTDSARARGGLKTILDGFARGEADFLVGTQMAAKGHDFSNLTLVGVVDADLGLNVADFRAAERTYQLLSQVSGRAGRRERPGRVYIQTRNPEHYSMTSARDHDYEAFYENEIAVRREFGYPPFARMALVRISGPDEAQVAAGAEKAAEAGRAVVGDADPELLEIYGPAPCPMTRLREKYRHQMMLRSVSAAERHRVLRAWIPGLRKKLPAELVLTVDVDPYSLL